jgi:hypothetical protein
MGEMIKGSRTIYRIYEMSGINRNGTIDLKSSGVTEDFEDEEDAFSAILNSNKITPMKEYIVLPIIYVRYFEKG